jgi:hypothetical protein
MTNLNQTFIYITPIILFLIFIIYSVVPNIGFFLEEKPIFTKKDFKTKISSILNPVPSSPSNPKEDQDDKKKRLQKELEQKKKDALDKHLAAGCFICFLLALIFWDLWHQQYIPFIAQEVLNILSEIFSKFSPPRSPGGSSSPTSTDTIPPSLGSRGSNSTPDGIKSPCDIPPLIPDGTPKTLSDWVPSFEGPYRDANEPGNIQDQSRGKGGISSPVPSKDALYPIEHGWVDNEGSDSPPAQIHPFNTDGRTVHSGETLAKESVDRNQFPVECEHDPYARDPSKPKSISERNFEDIERRRALRKVKDPK